MPDITSAVLVFVILVLTAIVIIFSFQIYFILKDFRKNLRDFDKILVNLGHLSSKLDDSISVASMVSLGAKVLTSFAALVRQNGKRDRE